MQGKLKREDNVSNVACTVIKQYNLDACSSVKVNSLSLFWKAFRRLTIHVKVSDFNTVHCD